VLERGSDDGAVVWAAESTLGADHECELGRVGVRLCEERVVLADARCVELGYEPEERLCVGSRGDGGLLCSCELGGGDHLHRAGDPLDVADRFHALFDVSCITHGRGW